MNLTLFKTNGCIVNRQAKLINIDNTEQRICLGFFKLDFLQAIGEMCTFYGGGKF